MKGTGRTRRGDAESPFIRATFSEQRVRGGVNSIRRFAAPCASAVWLAFGCFSPDVDGPCAVSCSLGCPEGWGCNEEYCVPPGYAGSCTSAAGGGGGALSIMSGGVATIPGGTGSSAGNMTRNSGGAASNTGGEPNGASTAGGSLVAAAGAAGSAGEGGAPSLTVQLTSGGSPCSGDVSVDLQVTAGKPPYEWVPKESCGLSFQGWPEGTAHLTGRAGAGRCDLDVSVEDSQGIPGELKTRIIFREVPAIDTAKLAPACLFEEFETELTAHGGDSDTRRFETNTPGWSVVAGKLHTHVTSETQRTVSVSVRDNYCSSAPVALELPVEAPGPERCFTTSFTPYPRPDDLGSPPAPCAGMPYDLRIEVAPEPASSNFVQLPPGLKPASGAAGNAISITGTAAWAPGEKSTLQFQLVRSDGRQFSYRYDLVARDKCWFAYVGRDAGQWQLHLWDPELGGPKVRANQDFGGADAEVTSMAFSPDGKFLVYQSTRATKVGLTLVDLRNLHEQPLSFTGNVEQYQWSPDSSLLAVVSRDTGTVLGGIDVSGASSSSQLETGVQGFTYLEPLAIAVESAPVWFGEHSLAIAAPTNDPLVLFTRFVHASATGYSKPVDVPVPTYDSPLTLLGFPKGYLASDGFILDFYVGADAAFARYPHRASSTAIAPTGEYVANTTSAGQLRWFPPDALEPQVAPLAQSEPGQCQVLLAWSSAGNSNACVTDSSDGGLRFLEAGSVDSTTLNTMINSTGYVYSSQSATGHRRLFSRAGHRFAFTTSEFLYVVDPHDNRFFRKYPVSHLATAGETATQANTIDLAFSANERFLVEHRARNLTVADLNEEQKGSLLIEDAMNIAPDCEEKYLDAPNEWCGAPSDPRDFSWSPHAAWFAFVNQSANLSLGYFPTGQSPRFERLNASCNGDCVRTFAFQP